MKKTLALAIAAGLILTFVLVEPLEAQQHAVACQRVTFGVRTEHRAYTQPITVLSADQNGAVSIRASIVLAGTAARHDRVTATVAGSSISMPAGQAMLLSSSSAGDATRATNGDLRNFDFASGPPTADNSVLFTVTE